MDYTYENGYERNDFSKYLAKCFGYMFLGLLITFAFGFFFSRLSGFLNFVLSAGYPLMIILSIVEVVLVIALSRQVYKLKKTSALVTFLAYALINSFTFAILFVLLSLNDIIFVFLATSLVFGVMAILGYTTKLDLSKLTTFIFISLIGLLIFGIVSLFVFDDTMLIIYNLLGVALFMLITAYDIHRIKHEYSEALTSDQSDTLAIYGALQLYLDFINIFIYLVQLLTDND